MEWVTEYLVGYLETDAVLALVAEVLRLIPLEPDSRHANIVTTNMQIYNSDGTCLHSACLAPVPYSLVPVPSLPRSQPPSPPGAPAALAPLAVPVQGSDLLPPSPLKRRPERSPRLRILGSGAGHKLHAAQKARRPWPFCLPGHQQHRARAVLWRQRKQEPPPRPQRIQPHRQRLGRRGVHIECVT